MKTNIQVKRIPDSLILYLKNLLHFDNNEALLKSRLKIEAIDTFLFSLSNCTPGLYTPENVSVHIKTILEKLHEYRILGFVKEDFLQENSILQQFFRLFEGLKTKKKSDLFFELEHIYNLVLLLLYMDLLVLEKEYNPGTKDELFYDLMVKKDELLKQISGGIRSSIKQKRISFQDRIYMGFDTEFKTLEYKKNLLLAFTTSTFSRFIFIIKLLKIDFSVHFKNMELSKNQSLFGDKKPLVSEELRILVYLIRKLRGCDDLSVEHLLIWLLKEEGIEHCLSEQEAVFFKKTEISPSGFINSFTDLRNCSEKYSLSNLISIGKENSNKNLRDQKDFLLSKITKEFEISITEATLDYNGELFRKRTTVFFLIAHFTVADLSSLSDFDLFKEKLKIIRKTFVTIGRSISIQKISLHIRDSSLLSIGGASLKNIGSLYEGMEKIDIGMNIKRMEDFMENEIEKFKAYAIQDSVLALFHSLKVEETARVELKKMFIPISLASFSGSFLQSKLDLAKYKLPLSPIYQTSLQEVFTPSGVDSNNFSLYLPLILGSMHGGRNESFLYGLCIGKYFDYDLPGAYPTGMSLLSYPDYSNLLVVEGQGGEVLLKNTSVDLLRSYTILKIKFQFPENCQYPNLPVRLDKSTIIYPLQGESICTGLEFVLAMKLNCSIIIETGVYIPFLTSESSNKSDSSNTSVLLNNYFLKGCGNSDTQKSNSVQRFLKQPSSYEELDLYFEDLKKLQAMEETPIDHVPSKISDNLKINNNNNLDEILNFEMTDFYKLVKNLIDERKKYPSKSYYNLLYKLIANSGIGQMSRGLSRKKSFNPSINSTSVIPSGILTNPLIASWITSFIRTVLSEILNYIGSLERPYLEKIIVSCTTDGFLCNIPDLNSYDFGLFSRIYRNARRRLGYDPVLLEVKHVELEGLLSWRTRGQLGLSSKIQAMTGYQVSQTHASLVKLLTETFNTTKSIRYMQFSLRSASDIFKKGGVLTQTLSERDFNLLYDNRRCIIEDDSIKTFFLTKPFTEKGQCLLARKIASLHENKFLLYGGIKSNLINKSSFKKVFIRLIIRCLFHKPEVFGLSDVKMTRVLCFSILESIGITVSFNYISQQKAKPFIPNSIPTTQETLELIEKLKLKYPNLMTGVLLRP